MPVPLTVLGDFLSGRATLPVTVRHIGLSLCWPGSVLGDTRALIGGTERQGPQLSLFRSILEGLMPPCHALARTGGLRHLTPDIQDIQVSLFLVHLVVAVVLIHQPVHDAGPAGTLLALLPLLKSDRSRPRYRLPRAI
ncbi:hypothetical protein ACIHFE_19960 [Streptomyces sp. NPDC052396]|uniref:hypothetical protein n=1 Tax=Streptomyces sp. NPDC052396 TaxID=3365689 RepID=UPI0037CE6A41